MTTASTAGYPSFAENRFLHRLCVGTAAFILISGFRPERVFDFLLENAMVLVCVGLLVVSYKRFPLSDASYGVIFVYLCLHEYGAHYKYSDVPLGEWMKPWLRTARNDYDRVSHFSFGLLLGYPIQEWFMRVHGVRSRWRYFLPVETILAASAIYEMLEAFMASVLSPQRGEEFVGMQGDMWDSQEDMAMAGLGALVAMVILAALRHRRAARIKDEEPAYATVRAGSNKR